MTNTIPNARLYLRSDAGSRLLVDFSRNGAFADDPTELVDNSWNPVFDSGGGPGEGDRTGPATTNLSAGAYTIRLQYEEGTAYEDMHLMRDGGISLAPYAGKIYRINGVAGRRLFFDRLDYHTGLADWELCGPEDQRAAGSGLGCDFDYTPSPSAQLLSPCGFPADWICVRLRRFRPNPPPLQRRASAVKGSPDHLAGFLDQLLGP